MALPNPPELRRLNEFMDGLPSCPHGCPNGFMYPSPGFRVPTLEDTIDDQVAEIIARYEREAAGMLRQHLAEDHRDVEAFVGVLNDALRRQQEREAAYQAWLDEAGPAICAELTAELIPAELRAAGVRFEWAEER